MYGAYKSYLFRNLISLHLGTRLRYVCSRGLFAYPILVRRFVEIKGVHASSRSTGVHVYEANEVNARALVRKKKKKRVNRCGIFLL